MANQLPQSSWLLDETGHSIQTDGEGIAEFDEANNLVRGIRWTEIQSYGAVSDPGAGILISVRSGSGQISFPPSLPGYTGLNSTILHHLPPGVSAAGTDLRSLLSTAYTGADGSRRFGRLGMIPWALLVLGVGVVFCFVGLRNGISEPAIFYVLPASFLLFGLVGLVFALNERYVVTADGITSYDGLGRRRGQIAWRDVLALEFKRHESGGRTGGSTDYYTLLGKSSHIDLDSMITDWEDLVRTIVSHSPPNASIDLGPASPPV